MGFFTRFSGKPLRDQAAFLAQTFSESCPPPNTKRKPLSTQKIDAALDAIYRQAAAFSREQRLGIFGRARFAKAFQDELLSRGYPTDLVMKITGALSATALASDRPGATATAKPPGST